MQQNNYLKINKNKQLYCKHMEYNV